MKYTKKERQKIYYNLAKDYLNKDKADYVCWKLSKLVYGNIMHGKKDLCEEFPEFFLFDNKPDSYLESWLIMQLDLRVSNTTDFYKIVDEFRGFILLLCAEMCEN